MRPTPLTGTWNRSLEGRSYRVDSDERVLAGHFPGFPIFPGVCILHVVQQMLRLDHAFEVTEWTRVRFIAPVFPGDELTLQVTKQDANQLSATVLASRPSGDREVVTVRCLR